MTNPIPLQPTVTYHIYNRGNNREDIFKEERNNDYFLKLWEKYIVPIADTYTYCLLPNHFHALVRLQEDEELTDNQYSSMMKDNPSRHFSNFFNAYAKAINKAYNRTGALFQRPSGRIAVTNNEYLFQLVAYIHQNPQRYSLVEDFRSWTNSSYHKVYDTRQGFIQRDEVLDWFGGLDNYKKYHLQVITRTQVITMVDYD